jgi:hypothetical protein
MDQVNYFGQTVKHLRAYEEVMLFANLLQVSAEDQEEVVQFLMKEYKEECLSYPCTAPAFDRASALWAAETVYTASQLLLYRENKADELELLLPKFSYEQTPSAVLSADLTLRFLPDILLELKLIDPEDPLISHLESHLNNWHYSGVQYSLPLEELNFGPLQESACLLQLYTDRVINYKKERLALHPALEHSVSASMGMYAPFFWSEFNQKRIHENEWNQ